MKHALRFSFLIAFGITSLTAQRPGGSTGIGTTPGAGSTSPGGGLPTTQPPSPSVPPTDTSPGIDYGPDRSAPAFISGKVVISDGSPVPQNTAIQRVCMGNPRTVAYADGKGHFSFQWGNPASSIMPDASESGSGLGSGKGQQGLGGRNFDPMGDCEIRASVVGFRSDSISLTQHRLLDNFDVGIIVLHRLANVEGTSISATSLAAPKDAAKAYEKGLQLLQKGKTDDAAKDFQKAVEVYPKYANAWLDLGRIQLGQKLTEPARNSFRKAVEADDKLVEAWAQLGLIAANASNWPDAAQCLDRALKLDPVDYPHLWLPNAVAAYNMKNLDVAEKSVREAIKADPGHHSPKADQLLGNVLLQRGDYAEAADELRVYMKSAPDATDLDQVRGQLARIEAIAQEPK